MRKALIAVRKALIALHMSSAPFGSTESFSVSAVKPEASAKMAAACNPAYLAQLMRATVHASWVVSCTNLAQLPHCSFFQKGSMATRSWRVGCSFWRGWRPALVKEHFNEAVTKRPVFQVLNCYARSRSCFSCTLARATDGRGDRRGRDEMHLSDEDAYSDYDDDQHDEPRATWGASPRARKAADKNLFANRAEPALVADLRGGEPLGANVLLFSSESTATSSISSFEEQEDGSMALALNVRHRPATPRNAPDRPAAPRSFSYSLPWYSPCPARCCRFAPRVQLAEHLLIKMSSTRPWQLEKDGRLHRCGGLARARAWNPFPRARAIRRPRI